MTLTQLGATATELTVREFGYTDEQTDAGSKEGMEQCIDKMATMIVSAGE